jgi:hypothetical protein
MTKEYYTIIQRSDYKLVVARITWYNSPPSAALVREQFQTEEDAEIALEVIERIGLKKYRDLSSAIRRAEGGDIHE